MSAKEPVILLVSLPQGVVAVCCSVLHRPICPQKSPSHCLCPSHRVLLHRVAVCCSVLQCVASSYMSAKEPIILLVSLPQGHCCIVLLCCSVLQCVTSSFMSAKEPVILIAFLCFLLFLSCFVSLGFSQLHVFV